MIKSVQILTPRSRELLQTTLQVSVLSIAALGLAGVVATAQTAAPSPQQPAQPPAAAQEVEKIKSQLVEVDTRIRAAQQKALQVKSVQEKQASYDTTLRTAMVKEEPKVKSLLEKQDNLVSELTKSDELSKPAEQRSPEFQERFQEFKKLSETLSPIAQRTSEKPEVAETYKAFQTVLTSEMEKVEPAVPQLLAQRGELISKYQQLVQSGR
jgi:chromosome segregation ATPase